MCGCSVAQSCPTLCDPMGRSTPGLPVPHQLPELAQTHVHRVGDATQPSRPPSSPSPPALSLSQHQGFFSMNAPALDCQVCSELAHSPRPRTLTITLSVFISDSLFPPESASRACLHLCPPHPFLSPSFHLISLAASSKLLPSHCCFRLSASFSRSPLLSSFPLPRLHKILHFRGRIYQPPG